MFIFCKGNNYLSLRNFIYSILVNSLFLLATKKGAILAPLHFAKVLIARRATTFGKVDYYDYQ